VNMNPPGTAAGQQPVGGVPGQPAIVGGRPVSSAGKRFGGYLLEAVLLVVTLVIGWIIWSLIVWGKGQTPAKAVLGMRVVRTDTGHDATWGTMALREFVGKGILCSLCGILTIISGFMILSQTRQGIWDKIASTVVVDDR
jgi:uncharacterized RDD family membrane protein YckC